MQTISKSLMDNRKNMASRLSLYDNYDFVYRNLTVGGKDACYYFVDGFCKDELMQKLLQFIMELKEEDMPSDPAGFIQQLMPYVEVNLSGSFDEITLSFLSGVFILLIEGYDRAILIDSRTYPARDVSEPEKEKSLRGSKDGFVETIVFNSALLRRRLRTPDFRTEMMNAGNSSHTDIVLCYMRSRVNMKLLIDIKRKLSSIRTDSLTMNQESLAECLYRGKWLDPFPKFRYTERPDTATAQILEGNIIILIDNSPSAMIIPATLFDIMEEPDDYYFPPVTGTYLRLSRLLIAIATYILTPTFLLLMQNRDWIPEWLSFIELKETENIPLVWQFLILELSIDGLKMAAVNTPNMLSMPLSVLAGMVLGEFSVNSGWFNAETMLYMAFVAVANYTQSNYEFGYSLKFFRVLNLITTALFGLIGYIGAILFFLLCLVCNKTISGRGYLYPLLPLNLSELGNRLFRHKKRVK